MIDAYILLFDAQKAHIRVIRNISHGDGGHQPAEKAQRDQQGPIPNICAGDNLYYFYVQ